MESSKPSRISVAHVYAKRSVRWNRNNSPLISGDVFADMSDLSVYGPKYRFFPLRKHELSDARIIFCDSRFLRQFLDENWKKINAKIIISGNSDEEFHDIPENLPKSVKAIFLQNSFISDNKTIFTLPIGIENFRWGVNGNPRLVLAKNKTIRKSNRILFGPFGNTHPDREKVKGEFSYSCDNWEYITDRISPKKYSETVSKFKFVASVRGNGVDTHRLWETLYRGSYPIVKEDNWSKSLRPLKLPIVYCSDWKINEINQILSENNYSDFKPKNLEPLWANYWLNIFKTFL